MRIVQKAVMIQVVREPIGDDQGERNLIVACVSDNGH
jgi:hypothetical protein